MHNCIREVLLLGFFVKCQAFVAVGEIDNAAILETVFFQSPLHGTVIPVGIDAQVGTLGKCPIETLGCDAGTLGSNSDAVDGAVRFVVEPGAIFDMQIGGINARDLGEDRQYSANVGTDVKLLFGNVLPQDGFGGMGIKPLVGVAGLPHKAAGLRIDLQDPGKVCQFCRTNVITHNTSRMVPPPRTRSPS